MLQFIFILISLGLAVVRFCSMSIKVITLYEEYKVGIVREPAKFTAKIWFRYLIFIGHYLSRINKSKIHYRIYYRYPKYKKLCKLMHLYNDNLDVINKFFYLIFPSYKYILEAPIFKMFLIFGTFCLFISRLLCIYDLLILTLALAVCFIRISESIIKASLILLKNKENIFELTLEYINIRITSFRNLIITHFVNFWITINLIVWVLFLATNFNNGTIALQ